MEWINRDGVIYHKYRIGLNGIHYSKEEDTTFGHPRFGEIKRLENKVFTLEYALDEKNKEEIKKYLPKELSYDEALVIIKEQHRLSGFRQDISVKRRKKSQSTLDASKVKHELLAMRKAKADRAINPSIGKTVHDSFIAFLEKIERVLYGDPFMHMYYKENNEHLSLDIFSQFLTMKIYDDQFGNKVDHSEFINM